MQGLEQCGITFGNTLLLAVELPICGIQALNSIGGINDLAYLGGKLEDWGNGIPVVCIVNTFFRQFFKAAFNSESGGEGETGKLQRKGEKVTM